jgi:hypothetical protein
MIRLSEKHGVNPSLGVCFFCMKDSGEVILFGRMRGDEEAPRRACVSQEPCAECKGWMEKGVILISVDPKRSESQQDPYRSGGWAVVKDEAVQRFPLDEKFKEVFLRKRAGFVEDEVWDALGLPRGDSEVADQGPNKDDAP